LTLFSYCAILFTPSFRRRRVINRESTLERVSTLFSLRTHARIYGERERRKREKSDSFCETMPGEIWRLPSYGKSAGTMQKNPLDDRALGLEWKAAKGESACSLFPISNRPSVVLTRPLSLPGSRRTFSDANRRNSSLLFFGSISCFVYFRITIAFQRLFAAAIKLFFSFLVIVWELINSVNLNWWSYLKLGCHMTSV